MLNIQTVLLLEDEAIIAIDIEDTLLASGVEKVVCMEWLSGHTPTLAVVDPRLKDGSCAEVVRHLVERDIPFVVYSGDVGAAVETDAAFGKGVALMKPSGPQEIEDALAAALGAPRLT